MTKRTFEPKNLKSVLDDIIKKNALENGLDGAKIQEVWSKSLGPNIQAYTKEVRLEKDVLVVRLNSSVLRQEMSYGKEKIIRLMNESLQKEVVKDIRFL
jgi:predicted nucleic acid-binding Zn ribbon protein